MLLNQRQAAAAHDVNRHVLAAAGAGTGKTRCVVARLLYLLGEDVAGRQLPAEQRLALRDVAAIAFTNAAAADLQKKLREALREAGRGDEAARVDTARIGTIHGFCGQILWEFALQVNRPPGLTALDEAEAAALGSEAARDALLEALEERSLPGLDELLKDLSVENVLGYAARLVSDADRLKHIARDDGLDGRERALVELAGRALALVHRRLGQRSAVDFDSMIVLTRDLLRDRPDVRRVLQRRIRVLIVDEFQDVDPVQQEIAWRLAEPESGKDDTTRLMLVGDPKQSIFRFRRSDVTIWSRAQRDFEAGMGAVHVLTENYRSQQPILAFVDAVLGPELDAPVGGDGPLADFEVPYQPLDPCSENVMVEPCVEVLTLPASGSGKARSGEDARRLEIPVVASRIQKLVSAGTPAGDIAILLSAWAPAEGYRDALAALGIRSWMLRNEGYYERREVLDCVVALRAVLDPLDDLSLFGFLRGPMVGVKDETLLAIARQTRPPYWRGLETVVTPEAELVAFGAGVVRRFQALRDRVPPDELLRGLLDETGYLAHLALLGEDGKQPEANVRKFVRLLHGWRELTVAGILRVVAEMRAREEGAREGDAPLAARRDAVTITSIHSAKGLEWPVVVWADLTRGIVAPDSRFLVGRNEMRLRSAAAARPDDDPRFAALRGAEAMEEQAQRKRLWYVAATRARERLIVSGVPLGTLSGRHAGTACSPVLRLGGLTGETVTYRSYRGETFAASVREASPVVVSAPVVVEPLPVLPVESLPVPWEPVQLPAGRARHSASELVTFARCRRKHWFIYAAGLREPPVERGSADYVDAVTRGHIVHDVLEHLRELDELDLLLEDAIGRWDPDAPVPEGAEGGRYRMALREEVALVASHPSYRAVADLPGARRELGFVHLLGGGRVMQGKIDLAAERDGELVLLDVKTGSRSLSSEAVRLRAQGYAPQREVYVSAAEAVSGRPVGEFAFHFSGVGEQVVTGVTGEVREGAARRVGEVLDLIEVGERAMTGNPQECRFCGFRVVHWCEGVGCE
jgi:ATP-dependent helicase/nuclease subunit A